MLHEVSKGKAITVLAYRRPQGLQKFEAPKVFRQSAYEGGKVVSHLHLPLSSSRENLGYSFVLEA
jgi:hypothetical protein